MDSVLIEILSNLESLENSQRFTDVIASIEDEIETLKWELRFLITFYKFIARDDCFDEILLFEVPIINAGHELVSLSYQRRDEVSAGLKNVVCNMLDKIKPIMPAALDCCIRGPPSLLNDHLLVEFIDDVVKDFTNLLISRARSSCVPDSVKPQVEALQEKLRFLRYFLYFVSKRGVAHEEMKDLLNHTQTVAVEAACLFYSLVEEMWPEKDSDMNLWCSNLLGKIGLTKPDVRQIYIQVLKDSSSSASSSVPPVRDEQVIADSVGVLLEFLPQLLNYVKADYITALRFELRFLVILLTDFPKQGSDLAENWNNILRSIEEVASESGYVIFSLFVNEMEEDISRQMDLKLSDLVEKMKLIKGEIKMRLLLLSTASRDNFPKTGGLEIIEFLVGNLKELLCSQADLIVTMKLEIETVGRELESLAVDMAKQSNDCEGMSNLWIQMLDVAYWAEYVIDSFVAKDNPEWYCILWLHCVIEEIKQIKAQLEEINMKDAIYQQKNKNMKDALPLQADGKLVVGFIPETEKLIKRLVAREPRHLDIVSIVGMSGLGKSTLAKKLYNHPSVTSQFKRIWCYVSPTCQKRNLLLEILRYLVDPKDIDQKSDDADLALMVYQNLKRKKYLIVLDDVWDIMVWNDLRMSFPDDKNGSRVMFTTQLLDVAKSGTDYLSLRSFDDEESWDLFSQIVFKPKSYSSELEKIGKKIVVSCRGIPLAVSLIAGLLVNSEKKEDWEKLEKNLSSQVVDDRIALCTRIAGLSYEHLPNHLKSCFLYYGAFIKNPEVPVQRLIWLWIAEGFIQKSETKGLEEAAEGYLNELISRSLVKIAKFKSKGGVKSCQVHDLVRDFCSAKAEEENVLKLVKRANPDESAHEHHGTTFEHHRLCIYSKLEQFVRSSPSGRRARTLLYFGAYNKLWSGNGAYIFYNFKLLRVLDMGFFNVGEFPTGLELFVHMRYLAMRVEATTIPPSLSDLWNLETIIITGTHGEIVLPDTIWKIAKLRHLHINDRATFGSNNQGEENDENSQLLLDDLETISTPCLQYGENSEKILRKIRNVRNMRCIFLDSWGVIGYREARRTCNRFPKLEILIRLESLKVFYHGKRLHPCEFSFPSNLKKLTLSKFRLPWNEISTIGKLSNLEVLKLRFQAFEGPRWDMIDGEFQNLKYLELDNLDISEWNASSDPFRSLRKLILKRCKQLKEVPFSFGDIRMLERIDVQWCSRSATDSVLQIRQHQKDQGNEEIHFSILPQGWDSSESSSEEREN